jgi:hypothetical protein
MKGEKLVQDYKNVWEKYKSSELDSPTISSTDKLLARGFVFQFDEEIIKPDVLFVGINPSYKHSSIKEELYYTKQQALQHSYFKPFKNIEDDLKKRYNKDITWTHMDMLVFRETKQSFIADHLFRSPEGLKFLMDQLTISKKVLEHIQPKVIVVSNTMARELLGRNRGIKIGGEEYGHWMGLEFEFDESIGTDVIINHETLSGTKVFFTSMLSGQRALDNGTKERLVWHINEVLK